MSAKNMTECPEVECAPCPSCAGQHAEVVHLDADGVECWQVHCPGCRMRGPRMIEREAAVSKWCRLSSMRDAVERVRIAPELFARYAMGPEALAMLRHGVPLASHPILAPNVDADLHRKALAGLDHCAAIAEKTLEH